MGPAVDVPVLDGTVVRLEPLSTGHRTDLTRAAEEERSSYGFTLVPRGGKVDPYLVAQLARAVEGLTPFAQVRVSDATAVGCTAFWDPRPWPDRDDLRAIEIGFGLSASAQGTAINADAKLCLFTYAFEALGVVRVDLMTDARNQRCRSALESIGARFEGVLRNWSPSWAPGEDGMLRDSAMFSVTAAEWPDVEPALQARVARFS